MKPVKSISKSDWCFKENLVPWWKGESKYLILHFIKTGLKRQKYCSNSADLIHKATPTKDKWRQLHCHPLIIYFKTLLKFSFSRAPPPPSGVIKSAGSSVALSHTVLERHPPSYYQVQPCDLKLWFCSNDNKGELRADAPNSSFPAW